MKNRIAGISLVIGSVLGLGVLWYWAFNPERVSSEIAVATGSTTWLFLMVAFLVFIWEE